MVYLHSKICAKIPVSWSKKNKFDSIQSLVNYNCIVIALGGDIFIVLTTTLLSILYLSKNISVSKMKKVISFSVQRKREVERSFIAGILEIPDSWLARCLLSTYMTTILILVLNFRFLEDNIFSSNNLFFIVITVLIIGFSYVAIKDKFLSLRKNVIPIFIFLILIFILFLNPLFQPLSQMGENVADYYGDNFKESLASIGINAGEYLSWLIALIFLILYLSLFLALLFISKANFSEEIKNIKENEQYEYYRRFEIRASVGFAFLSLGFVLVMLLFLEFFGPVMPLQNLFFIAIIGLTTLTFLFYLSLYAQVLNFMMYAGNINRRIYQLNKEQLWQNMIEIIKKYSQSKLYRRYNRIFVIKIAAILVCSMVIFTYFLSLNPYGLLLIEEIAENTGDSIISIYNGQYLALIKYILFLWLFIFCVPPSVIITNDTDFLKKIINRVMF